MSVLSFTGSSVTVVASGRGSGCDRTSAGPAPSAAGPARTRMAASTSAATAAAMTTRSLVLPVA